MATVGSLANAATAAAVRAPAGAATAARPAALARAASFEISARDRAGLEAACALIPAGALVTISWQPRECDDDRVAMAKALAEAGFEVMPHVAARHIASRAALDRLLGRLAGEAGVTRAFVVGGDWETAAGPFAGGLDALASGLFARHGFAAIGLPGYPEGHPLIGDDLLARDLGAKLAHVREAGMAPMLLTQFAFEAAPILAWLEALRRREPDLPVRIGLAGPARIDTLLRYAAICGLGASVRGITRMGGSMARMLREAGPGPVIRGLAESPATWDRGPTALHFFPFGGLPRTARWVADLASGGAAADEAAGVRLAG